jgi:hypothetical protein
MGLRFPFPATALPGSTTAPLMDGVAAAGTSGTAADGAHVHPSDTGRTAAPVTAPLHPNSAGTAGTWAYSSGYVFFCVAPNTWLRFAPDSTFS